MSSTIPPFLCSTPPPIDFDETIDDNEDDFGSFEANDSEYGVYNDDSDSLEKIKTKPNNNLELPLPHETNFSLFLNESSHENVKDIHKNEIKNDENNITEKFVIDNSDIEINTENDSITKINDSNYSNKNDDKQKINNYLNNYETEDEIINQITNNLDNYLNVIDSSPQKIRDGSPQSLELNCNLSADEDNYSIGDFQNADIVNKYDDNTSLPSLKFDPVVDTQQILKNDTQIFEHNQSSTSPTLSSSVILKSQQELINEKITKESPPVSSSSSPQEDTLNFSAFETGNTEKFYNNENVDPNTSPEKAKYNENFDNDESNKDHTSFKTNTENLKSSNNHINEVHNVIIESNDDNKNSDDKDNNSDNEFDGFETFTCDRTEMNIQQKSLEDPVVFNSNDVSNTFEADFSQFEAFNENNHSNLPLENNNDIEVKTEIEQIKENEFKDFHDNYEEQIDNDLENKKNDENNEENDDDDDFGEFSEFSDCKMEAKSIEIETVEEFPSLTNLQDKLKSVIDMMFPSVTNTENSINADNENYQRNEDKIDKFETNINDIDSAKALEYQWLQSNTKHSLIKALGIDSRNILYGEKWNSHMPRFAANLAFNPLEPLKPIKITSENHLTTKTKDKIPENKSKTDIPAVEFDWNSSGLINPLDGIKEILQERKMDTIHSTESNSDNQSIKIEKQQQQQQQQTNETTNKNIETSTNTTTFVSDINDDITTIPIPESSDTQQSSSSSSSSTNVKDFQLENINNQLNYTENPLNQNNLIEEIQHHHQYPQQHHNQQQHQQQHHHHKAIYPVPLKETHIFTQDNKSKSISINKEINNDDNDKKCSIDFDYEMAAAGIIINENVVKKEYRDIEYNPRKLKTTTIIYDDDDDDGDADKELQTTSTTTTTITMDCCNHECDKKNIKTYNEEENFNDKNEIKINNLIENKQNINSKEILNFPKSSTDTDLTVFTSNSINTSNNFYNLENNDDKFLLDKNTKIVNDKHNLDINNFDNKHDEDGEDDFTEFQYAPPPKQQQQQKPSLSQQSSINVVPLMANITNNVKQQQQQQQTNKKSSQLVQNNITSRPSNVVIDEMILSPAVLLPKTIEIENHEPKINWPEPGINPEELERLEKIFPQPKSSFQKSSTDLPFSGDKSKNDNNDDDDWSDFISVQPTSNIKTISPIKSNTKIICHQQQQQKQITVNNLSQFDDEWSDFCYVSVPPTSSSSTQFHHPSSSFSKIACVSDSFSGIINSTTQPTTWQQLPQNQFLQSLTTSTAAAATTTTTTVPISQYYQGNYIKNINNGTNKSNIIQQQQQQHQNLLNGFSTTIPNHKMYFNEQTMPSNYNSSNNISPINQQQQYHHHHHHHLQQQKQQQQKQNKILIKNSNSMSLIPDLTFATPKNLINSSSKSNIPKK